MISIRATLTLLAFLTLWTLPVTAGNLAIHIERMALSALESGEIEILTAAADPGGRGLVVLDHDSELSLVSWDGKIQPLTQLATTKGDYARPVGLYSSPSNLLIIRQSPPGLAILDQELGLQEVLPFKLLRPFGQNLIGRRLFVIGEPLVPPPGEAPQWRDLSWRRKHLRSDCGIFTVDLDSPKLEQEPALCDSRMNTSLRRALPSGAFVATTDGRRVFAVLEGRPTLIILDADGRLVREVSTLEKGEKLPEFTEGDLRAQFTSPKAAMALRDRLPWFVGLLRFERAVGVIFRRWDGKRVHFEADLFDFNGNKLANDLDLGLPLAGHSDYLKAIPLPDGRMTVLAMERTADRKVTSRHLFQLTLDRTPEQSSVAPEPTSPRLRFQLLDELTGEPVRAARLEVVSGKRTRRREISSVDGFYSETGFASDLAKIQIEAEGYLTAQAETDLAVDTNLGTLLLDPGARVFGHLLRSQDGAPLTEAEVLHIRPHRWGSLVAERFGLLHRARSDSEGRFALGGLEAGPACLRITAPTLAASALWLEALEEGEQRELGTVLLHPAKAVSGKVVDGSGEPLEATVELRAGPATNPCLRLPTHSGADGRFHLNAVPGRYQLVVLLRQELIASQAVVISSTAREERLGTVKTRVRQLAGQIRVHGVQATGEWVTLEPANRDTALPTPVFMAGAGAQELLSDLAPQITALPTDSGIFEGQGYLAQGEAVLTYRDPSGAQFRRPFATTPGAGTLTFSIDFEGAEASGISLSDTGDPVAAATLELVRGDFVLRTVASTAKGRFSIPAVPAGRYTLRAKARTLSAEQPLFVPDPPPATLDPIEIELSRSQAASIEVEMSPGDSSEPPRATLLLTDGKALHRVLTGRGSIRFEGLPAGLYQIIAFHHGGLSTASPVELRRGQSRRIRLPARETQSTRLDLGQNAAGRTASLLTAEGTSLGPLLNYLSFSLSVDSEGYLDLPALEPGSWQLRLGESSALAATPFHIRAGKETLDLRARLGS